MAWYDTDWQYRKSITVQNGKVTGNLTNFPVLISLSSDSDLSSKAQVDGDDILFTSSDEVTKLDHEIESYASGTLVAWVKVPSVSSTVDTVIYMYYGNGTVGSQENATGVWDANYKAVWHLHNDFLDSTSNNNDGTNQGTVDVAAKIADGQTFAGGDYIDIGQPASLDIIGDLTVSAWVKVDGGAGTQRPICGKGDTQYMLRAGDNNNFDFFVHDGGWAEATSDMNFTNGVWYYVCGQLNGTEVSVWVDSVKQTDTPTSNITSNSSDVEIGRNSGATSRDFHGDIDEVRISNTARSTSWIQTEYNNQDDPSTFYVLGTEEEAGWSAGNVNTVTPDNLSAVNTVSRTNITDVNDV